MAKDTLHAAQHILPAHRVGAMVNNMQPAILLDTLPSLPDIEANDPNDTFLLAMALASEADYLATGAPGCCNAAASAVHVSSLHPHSAPRRFNAMPVGFLSNC